MRGIIAAVAALLIFGIAAAVILSREKQEKELHQRLNDFSQAEPEPGKEARHAKAEKKDQRPLSERLIARVQKTSVHMPEFSLTAKLDERMEMADWPFLGRDYVVILAMAGAILALVLGLATMNPGIALAGFAVGIVGGLIILDVAIQRRRKAFVNQLGDMLTMVANALRAGFSFMQAFELISKEMDAPVGREVAKVIREVNIGASLETALEHMQQRMQSPDFNLVVTAVLIQRQVGGNLAEILDTIGGTIQERIRMRREVYALTAQGRMSGIVLTGLPFGLAAVLQFINPNYLTPLFTESMGKMAVGGALVSIALGYFIIQKIVDIKP